MGRLGEAAARAAVDLARLAVPVWCAGCGERDVRWCEDCAAAWWSEPLRSESSAGRLAIEGSATLPVWAVTELSGAAHAMVATWKDGGRRDLDRFFADAAQRAARAVAPAVSGLGAMAVVPVPSRRASVRRRGADLPLLLGEAVARGLEASGIGAVVAPALTAGRGEQRGASVRQRWRQAASVQVKRGWPQPLVPGCDTALLVDDVLTTGATMAAAARALQVRFLTVSAGLCLASAPATGVRRNVTLA